MKCSLGISNFLEEISSLSHSVVFLYFFALIAEEGFLISAWLSGEALQIAVKRREVKSKEEKERYKHRNAEFQRIARRDKKAFSETTYFELKMTLGAEYRERQGN